MNISMAKTNSSLTLPKTEDFKKLNCMESLLQDLKYSLAKDLEELKLEIFAIGENLPVKRTSKIFLDEVYVQHPYLNFEMKKKLIVSNAYQEEEDKKCSYARYQAKSEFEATNGLKVKSNEASIVFENQDVPKSRLSIRSTVKSENAPTKEHSKPKDTKPRGSRVSKKERVESSQPQQRFTQSQSRKEAISSGLLGENNIDSTGDKKALKSSLPREDKKRKYTRKVKIEAAPLDTPTKINTERYVAVPAKDEKQVESTTGSRRTNAAVKIEHNKRKHTRPKLQCTTVTSTSIQIKTDRSRDRNCNEAASIVEGHHESIRPILKSEAVLMDHKSTLAQDDRKMKYTQREVVGTFDLFTAGTKNVEPKKKSKNTSMVEKKVESKPGSKGTVLIDYKSTLKQEHKIPKHPQSKLKTEVDPKSDLIKATKDTGGSTNIGKTKQRKNTSMAENQVESTPGSKGTCNAVLTDHESTLRQERKIPKHPQQKCKTEVASKFDLGKGTKDTGGSTNIGKTKESKNASKAEKQVESTPGSKGTCNAVLIDHRSTLQQEHEIPKHPQQKWETEVDAKFDLVTATNYTDKSISMQMKSTTERNGTSGSILIEHEFTLPQEDVKRKYIQSEERNESATFHSYSEPKAKKPREAHVQTIQHQSNIPKDITRKLLTNRSLPQAHNKQGVSIQAKARSDVGPLKTAASVPDVNLRSSKPENSQNNRVSDDSVGCVFQPGPPRIYTADEKKYMSQVLVTSPKDIQATLMNTINQIESKVYTFPFNLDALKPETLKYLLNATFTYVKYNYHPKYMKLDDYIINYN